MSYYNEIEQKINGLIDSKQYKNAYKIIETELSMPYIPTKYEKIFENLRKNIIQIIMNKSEKSFQKIFFDKETILNIINSKNNPMIPLALSQLKDYNLTNLIDEIKLIFVNKQIKNSIKFIIFEYLVEQKVSEDIEIKTKFNTSILNTNKSFVESEDYKKIMNKLHEIYFKEPSLLKISESYINQFFINFFPEKYQYKNGDEYAIKFIVDKAIGNNNNIDKKYMNNYIFIYKILKRYIM